MSPYVPAALRNMIVLFCFWTTTVLSASQKNVPSYFVRALVKPNLLFQKCNSPYHWIRFYGRRKLAYLLYDEPKYLTEVAFNFWIAIHISIFDSIYIFLIFSWITFLSYFSKCWAPLFCILWIYAKKMDFYWIISHLAYFDALKF